jgi:uncharacterized damage-inducible protein DinB
MNFIDSYLKELDRETVRTRRALEAVPKGQDDWAPHPKSMPLARLAGLVATMPSWITLIIDMPELDIKPPQGQGQYQQPSIDTLGEVLDGHVAKARESLGRTNEPFLVTTTWRLLAGGVVAAEWPRHVVLRETMNHLAHHRGQLTVYLRLLGQPVPSMYGPTADDPTFG